MSTPAPLLMFTFTDLGSAESTKSVSHGPPRLADGPDSSTASYPAQAQDGIRTTIPLPSGGEIGHARAGTQAVKRGVLLPQLRGPVQDEGQRIAGIYVAAIDEKPLSVGRHIVRSIFTLDAHRLE